MSKGLKCKIGLIAEAGEFKLSDTKDMPAVDEFGPTLENTSLQKQRAV